MAVVFGMGLSIGAVLPPLVTSSIFSKDVYGEAYGFVQSAMQVGAAIGPLLVSILFEKTGTYNYGWLINIAFALLTGTFWIIAHRLAVPFANKTEK